MKLFNFTKEENYIKFKIFGISLFTRIIDKNSEIEKIKILLGLIYIKRNFNLYSVDVRFLGIKILKAESIDLEQKLNIDFPTITIFKRNITKTILKELETFIPSYCDAYIFTCRSGEYFLIMHHFQELVSQYGSKEYVILTPFQYHVNIGKMFYPDLKIIKIPIKFARLNRNQGTKIFNFSKFKRVIIPIEFNYYTNHEKKIHKNQYKHFYEELIRVQNLKGKDLHFPLISNNDINSVKTKIKNMNLKNKFVILSIESQSNSPINENFWVNLTQRLQKLNYDVYFNSMKNNQITQYGKTCYMTHSETCYLSTFAEATIGLRSGFMDVIAPFSNKTICLYTDFRDRRDFKSISAQRVKDAYSLVKIPNAKNIYETCITEGQEEFTLSKIMELL